MTWCVSVFTRVARNCNAIPVPVLTSMSARSLFLPLFFLVRTQVLLTEPPMNPMKNRERMIEVCPSSK